MREWVSIVTGGGTGLGAAIVQRLAEDGHRVVIVGLPAEKVRDTAAAVRAQTGREVGHVVADLGSETRCVAAYQEVRSRYGPAGVVVNNAAIYPSATLEQTGEDLLHHVVDVNLGATLWISRCAIADMRTRRAGRIVNISSLAIEHGMPEMLAYVASKAAVVGVTRSLALELGPWDITVNCVLPGAFPTDAEKVHPDPEAFSRAVIQRQALKRRGAPEELAAVVAFFAGPDSSFVTGQTLAVCGGAWFQ